MADIEQPQELEQGRMTFGEHLEALRRHLIRGLLGIGLILLVTLYYGRDIIGWLLIPLNRVQFQAGLPEVVVAPKPTTGFTIYIKVSILCAFVIGVPWLVYQIWKFVETGLYANERRVVMLLAPFSSVMAILGVLFMYFIMLPVCLTFLVVFSTSYPQAAGDDRGFLDVLSRAVGWFAESDTSSNTESDSEAKDKSENGSNQSDKKAGGDTTKKQEEKVNPFDVDPIIPDDKKSDAKTDQKTQSDADTKIDPDSFTVPRRDKDPPNPQLGELWFNQRKHELRMFIQTEDDIRRGKRGRIVTFKPALSSVLWPLFDIEAYISFVIFMTIGVVIGFQLPVIMFVIGFSKIVDPRKLAKGRKFALMTCVVAGAILTPADPISMGILAVPLYLLFEFGLVLMRHSYGKGRDIDEDEDEGSGDDQNGDGDEPTAEPA